MSEFDVNKRAFLDSCLMYKGEIQEYLDLLEKNDLSLIEEEGLSYIKNDIDYIHQKFSELEETHGTCATLILWMLYVEGKTKTEVCEYFSIPKAKMTRDVKKWEHRLFD